MHIAFYVRVPEDDDISMKLLKILQGRVSMSPQEIRSKANIIAFYGFHTKRTEMTKKKIKRQSLHQKKCHGNKIIIWWKTDEIIKIHVHSHTSTIIHHRSDMP